MSPSAPDAAVFEDPKEHPLLPGVLERIAPEARRLIIVSDSTRFLGQVRTAMRLSWSEIGLDREEVVPDDVVTALGGWLDPLAEAQCLIVDMSWIAGQVHGQSGIETWAGIAERIAAEQGVPVVSRYHRDLLTEDQVQTALAAHRQILAPSGLYENPHWMPAETRRAPKGEQMSYLLGRMVPDYAGQRFFERDDRFAARGADPDWLARPGGVLAGASQGAWQIYCFGQLRVYKAGDRIDWKIRGGAPKKTRTLFAYLLTHGEKGAHADRIAELLWPDRAPEEIKRARLHHTVAMLRRTLGDHDAVIRTGDFYRLNPPEGSWIDITSFEQLCRRGVTLFRSGRRNEALTIYRTAEKLYSGDLFQDVPVQYLEDEQEDWCLPRRIWLREMALKLQRDMSALLREEGRLRAALEHCQKALALDPTSDDANMETMRVYHAQGRPDTVARQYRQYRKAMEMIDATHEGSHVQALYLALTGR